jgi:NAD(P)-dependent dehydrogenase (short-subunit alcohol dehydrogenase family)
MFTGKVIIVTGGSGNVGSALAALLASRGARIAAVDRRSWRKLHIGIDAGSGEIVAIELTEKDVDDAARTGGLLD